jgi:serine/threonine-protein kinase
MLDRIKNMFASGILTRYKPEATVMRQTFFTISAARDARSMRPVLVKIYTDEGMEVENKIDKAYRREPLGAILPGLVNRAIVKTIETGHAHGKNVEILEQVTMTTLRELMDSRRLTGKLFRRIITEVGEALSYLHHEGYIHRAISPDGIVVSTEGDAKIIDMSLIMDANLTVGGGTMVGPSGYVAPEIIRRGAVDARSDIYSLGVIMYEFLAGARPFPPGHGYEGLLKIINTKPLPLIERNPNVSRDLNDVVMKALARKAVDRFTTVDEMLAAFAAVPMPEHNYTKAPSFAAA